MSKSSTYKFVSNTESVVWVTANRFPEDGLYIIYDLNSSGGTYINNKRVQTHALRSGDVILLGQFPIMFIYADVDDQFDKLGTSLLT